MRRILLVLAALAVSPLAAAANVPYFTGVNGSNPIQFPAVLPDLNNLITDINATGGTFNGPVTIGGFNLGFGLLYTSAGAPTAAGIGYVAGDAITLNGGTCSVNPVVIATGVTSTAITNFWVQTPGICTIPAYGPLAQASTSGIGTGATFPAQWGPIASTVYTGNLANGGGNFAIGGTGTVAAGASLLNGTENSFVGYGAGSNVTTGSFNTAMGHNAMGIGGGCSITGGSNTAFGTDALRDFCGGSGFTAIGANALKNQTVTGANGMTAIGTNAMLNENNSNGGNNSTALGNNAGSGHVGTASYRGMTFLGANTGGALTTATNSTLIGSGVGNTTMVNGGGVLLIGSGNIAVDTPGTGTNNYINIENALIGYSSGSAPTIASGFAATGSTIAGTTFEFRVTVGSGTPGSTGTVTMPAAANGWDCTANDVTTTSSSVFLTKQSGGSATTVVLTNYNTSAAATAWVGGDVLNVKCLAY